ncbi:hypothetical protein THASP1DRAFT_11512, partial [Thamnocephalis sphaerospora]
LHHLPNEVLGQILYLLQHQRTLYACLMVSRRFCLLTAHLLWMKPAFADTSRVIKLLCTLSRPATETRFSYARYIRYLNLQQHADAINDDMLRRLRGCDRLERINLAGCRALTAATVRAIVPNWWSLITLDLSKCVEAVSDDVLRAVADNCSNLQNAYFGGCKHLTDDAVTHLATSCTKLRRINLSYCEKITDVAAMMLSNHCAHITEVDFSYCQKITDAAMLALLPTHPRLRELRLRGCFLITDEAFAAFPFANEYMRVLDITSCPLITDVAVQTVATRCPRLRSIDLGKCVQITNNAVRALLPLGRSLQSLHLGHCSQITDQAVILLAHRCMHLRYLDLGCCVRITDASVEALARLPRLRRLGLVRCLSVTDAGIMALALTGGAATVLERIHLSYCINLTVNAVRHLMNACPNLAHLSVTGVPDFQHKEIQVFCREPPEDFNVNQRASFCVFSGQGVRDVRDYLN